jgi:hypothetical protein
MNTVGVRVVAEAVEVSLVESDRLPPRPIVVVLRARRREAMSGPLLFGLRDRPPTGFDQVGDLRARKVEVERGPTRFDVVAVIRGRRSRRNVSWLATPLARTSFSQLRTPPPRNGGGGARSTTIGTSSG